MNNLLNKINKSNLVFFIILLIGIFSIPVLNYFVDPYAIFFPNRNVFRHKNDSERDTINQRLKLTKNLNYDYILIGDSNNDLCFNPDDFISLTGKSLVLLSLQGISPKEQLVLLKEYINLHPNTKNVIISVNFMSYIGDNGYNLFPFENTDRITIQEYGRLLFTLKATYYTFDNIFFYYLVDIFINLFSNIRDKINNPIINKLTFKVPIRFIFPKLRVKINNCKQYYNNILSLKEIVSFLKEKNINAIYITNCCHSYQIANIYMQGYYNQFLHFKEDVAVITPYYDLSYINKYNTEPISLKNLYWQDSMHATDKYGRLVFEEIFANKQHGTVVKIDKNNCETILKNQTQTLMYFLEKNKSEINEYMKIKYENLHPIKQFEYI